MTKNTNVIPPIIVDYLEKLNDPKSSRFQKDLALSVIENVHLACGEAIRRYNAANEKAKTARR